MHRPDVVSLTHARTHTHTCACTLEKNSHLWMELRWLFNSLHFPAFSQGAYANAGHFIFSGDKTINTVLKKQTLLRRGGGCGSPRLRLSLSWFIKHLQSRLPAAQAQPPGQMQTSRHRHRAVGVGATAAWIWACLRRNAPQTRGHCEGAVVSKPLLAPEHFREHTSVWRGHVGRAPQPCSRLGQTSCKEQVKTNQLPWEEYCGHCHSSGGF